MKYILKLGVLSALLLTTTSCNKWLDINQDPTQVLTAPLNQRLTAAEAQLAFNMGSDIHRFSSLIAQHFAGQGATGTQSREFTGYNIQAGDMNTMFRTHFFAGALSDLEELIKASGTSNPYYAGIAKILKAYSFHIVVDAWGDVPFTEAFNGALNLQPKYDNSEAIYAALFGLLDAGIADLNAGTSEFIPGADDVIFAGNRNKWKKFAFTLQLRLALRYTDKAARIDAIIAKTGSSFMSDNNDSFQCAFQASSGRQNPIDQFEIRRLDQFFPNATLVDMMNAKSDPRRRWYFTPISGTTFLGNPNSYTAPQFHATSAPASRMHIYLRGDSIGTSNDGGARGRVDVYGGAAPIRMLTYAEYQFILAEYHFAKGSTANAQTAFQAAIRASMEMANVPTASINNYIAANGTLNSGTEMSQIIGEKYVANYGVAMESWSDWRRTNFPALVPTTNGLSAVIPRILPYAQAERDTNPNTPARANMYSKSVFWDR